MNKSFRLLPACISMLIAVSCTKTDTIAPPELSQSRILEYKITNVQGDPIAGAVNEKDSTITIYLPAHLQLVTLEPSITVSANATVTPASGTLIEDLLKVFREGRDIRYVVTGKNGVKRTYTLHIKAQQAPLTVTELSTATLIKEYTVSGTATNINLGVNITGAGFSENRDLMSVVLVDETGKEFPTVLGLNSLNDTYAVTMYIQKPNVLGEAILNFTGSKNFRIRVYSYALQATTQFPIKITKT